MATNPLPGEEDPKKRRASGAPQPNQQPRQPSKPQPDVSLGSVLNGGPGTVNVGGFKVSHLPDYSNQPPSAQHQGAVAGYDQMPPDRVQQKIAARGTPLMTAPGGSDTAGRLVDSGLNVARGFGKLALGGAEAVVAPVLDTARNGVTRLAGGDPETLPGGSSGFFNSAMANVREGWEPIANGGQQIGAGVRGLLGAQPAQAQGRPEPASAVPGQASQSSTPSMPKKPAAPAPADSASGSDTAQPGQEAPAAGQPKGLGFRQTGINGVVGRRNAQGVMEFSNEQADVAGASGERLVDGTIGDGVGGLSVGQAGDAQTALGRFERANAERAGMIEASRRGAIGDTGNFTVVADGTRGSQEDRDMEARRRLKYGTDVAMERNRLEGQQLRQSGINSYLDRQLREREVANTEQTGALQRQQAEQELQTGQLTLEQQQQLQDLRTRLADPNVKDDERQKLTQAYAALTTPSKDRYVLQDVVMGQDALGKPVFGKAALDVVTGQTVGQTSQSSTIASDPRAIAIKNNPDLSRDEKSAQLKALGYN